LARGQPERPAIMRDVDVVQRPTALAAGDKRFQRIRCILHVKPVHPGGAPVDDLLALVRLSLNKPYLAGISCIVFAGL
jgi:hypothetical protein